MLSAGEHNPAPQIRWGRGRDNAASGPEDDSTLGLMRALAFLCH